MASRLNPNAHVFIPSRDPPGSAPSVPFPQQQQQQQQPPNIHNNSITLPMNGMQQNPMMYVLPNAMNPHSMNLNMHGNPLTHSSNNLPSGYGSTSQPNVGQNGTFTIRARKAKPSNPMPRHHNPNYISNLQPSLPSQPMHMSTGAIISHSNISLNNSNSSGHTASNVVSQQFPSAIMNPHVPMQPYTSHRPSHSLPPQQNMMQGIVQPISIIQGNESSSDNNDGNGGTTPKTAIVKFGPDGQPIKTAKKKRGRRERERLKRRLAREAQAAAEAAAEATAASVANVVDDNISSDIIITEQSAAEYRKSHLEALTQSNMKPYDRQFSHPLTDPIYSTTPLMSLLSIDGRRTLVDQWGPPKPDTRPNQQLNIPSESLVLQERKDVEEMKKEPEKPTSPTVPPKRTVQRSRSLSPSLSSTSASISYPDVDPASRNSSTASVSSLFSETSRVSRRSRSKSSRSSRSGYLTQSPSSQTSSLTHRRVRSTSSLSPSRDLAAFAKKLSITHTALDFKSTPSASASNSAANSGTSPAGSTTPSIKKHSSEEHKQLIAYLTSPKCGLFSSNAASYLHVSTEQMDALLSTCPAFPALLNRLSKLDRRNKRFNTMEELTVAVRESEIRARNKRRKQLLQFLSSSTLFSSMERLSVTVDELDELLELGMNAKVRESRSESGSTGSVRLIVRLLKQIKPGVKFTSIRAMIPFLCVMLEKEEQGRMQSELQRQIAQQQQQLQQLSQQLQLQQASLPSSTPTFAYDTPILHMQNLNLQNLQGMQTLHIQPSLTGNTSSTLDPHLTDMPTHAYLLSNTLPPQTFSQQSVSLTSYRTPPSNSNSTLSFNNAHVYSTMMNNNAYIRK